MSKINFKFLKKLSKNAKIIIAASLVLVMAGVGTLIYFLTRKDGNTGLGYADIYRNYQSAPGFSRAVEKLRLSNGVTVASYDIDSGIFVLKKTIVIEDESEDEEENSIELYGFANEERVLAHPSDHVYLGVLDVQGNYAIVATGDLEEEEITYKIGLIRFDADGVYEYGFYHDYREYLYTVSFQGDYIAMFAGQYYQNPASASYTVFYDYKSSDDLLEAFRVEAAPNYIFDLAESNLVAVDSNKAYFYNIHDINAQGYLNKRDTYFPFEDEVNYPASYISFSISYLGNNWFIRKAIFYQTEPFPGYKYVIPGERENEYLYVLQKNDRYNAANKMAYGSDILLVDKVANSYSHDIFSALAAGANFSEISQGPYIIYSEPAFPPSGFIKEGYSIVYNYFFPDYSDKPESSYLILDSNANIIRQERMYLPPLFVDGIGVENASINYPNLIGDAQAHYLTGEKKVLKEYVEGKNTYESTFVNDGMMVVYEYKITGTTAHPKAGAFNMSTMQQAIPFMYDNLSMFAGGYAIGAVLDLNSNLQYYRVSKDGEREPISHVYSVKHGVYVTYSSTRKALWSYDGAELIPNRCDDIFIYEIFLSDDKLLESIVVTQEGNDTVIYRLI